MRILGVILIVIGILAFVIPSISFTKKEKILDVGPLQVTADKEKSVSIPSLLGVTAVAAGTVLVVVSVVSKKN